MSLVLLGCGESWKPISFDNFQIKIDKEFSKVDKALIEDNQITNQIVTSFKKENNNNFSPNVIVTKTQVKPKISSKEFGRVNIKRLTNKLKRTKVLDTGKTKFTCQDQKINISYGKFHLENSYFTNKAEKYYLVQQYFLYNDTGYIISFASKNKNILEKADNSLKSIKCLK